MTAHQGDAIARLNAECFCLPLAPDALTAALGRRLPAADLHWAAPRLAGLTAEQPLFLPAGLKADLLHRIRAIGTVLLALAAERQAPDFKPDAVLAGAVFDSFDFHLTTAGPKLIEINTNAGGAFAQPLLLEALTDSSTDPGFAPEQCLIDAYVRLAVDRRLTRLAIVDSRPEAQPLYLDMRLAALALEARGIAVDILDVTTLRRESGRLLGPNGPIDMVYNRLTDFELETPDTEVLRAAWQQGEVVLAPNPDVYRTFADKQLLIALTDAAEVTRLAAACDADAAAVLNTVPATEVLDAGNAERLWSQRRDYVFKPGSGYGSRGVYRGDKISRSKWREILDQRYLAQRFAEPSQRSQRSLRLAGGITPFKVDIRVWTHGIEPVFAAARLYAGQVMGFRSEGAGFAPILWIDPDGCDGPCQDIETYRALCNANVQARA
ncbi:MAG: hypothetical protein JJU22_11970 [Gammaproteobacteria bacterium]|nr:hypothetical protein [Gammaproteobacteria bacterium]